MTALSTPIPIQTQSRQTSTAPAHANGPVITCFQCLLTLGLLPLLLWPTRWAEYLDNERHDLIELAAWWRRRVDSTDAARLDKIVRRFQPRPILMVLPWLAVGFNVVLIATLFMQGDDVKHIWNQTFGHAAVTYPRSTHWEPVSVSDVQQLESNRSIYAQWRDSQPSQVESHLYLTWVLSLGIAYLCQWYAVRSHAVAVHALVKWTNRLARENQFSRIKNESLKIGLNFWWIIMGIGMSVAHAWWAIPMVFAGAMQRRYSAISSPALRAALAAQAHEALAVVPGTADRFCQIDQCGTSLPARAKFCPRCGKNV